VLFVTLLACSMYGLSVASRTIPIGTAYAVWVGIGAAGALLVGAALEQRMLPPAQLLSVAALVAAVVAVKLSSAH
jgi:quaternary ammonium compound-resistance protein SugE